MFLGDLIKNFRTQNKLSQREFAKLCNLSHTYIAALEKNIDSRTGKPIAPTLDTVKYVSKAMNMSVEDILHLLDDEQEFNLKNEAPKFNDFRYASNNGIDTEGLDENDIAEINKFIEFIKNKKKQTKED